MARSQLVKSFWDPMVNFPLSSTPVLAEDRKQVHMRHAACGLRMERLDETMQVKEEEGRLVMFTLLDMNDRDWIWVGGLWGFNQALVVALAYYDIIISIEMVLFEKSFFLDNSAIHPFGLSLEMSDDNGWVLYFTLKNTDKLAKKTEML
ncbi:hypothetical protein ACLB2K_063319 [Fragaria x ananassa]